MCAEKSVASAAPSKFNGKSLKGDSQHKKISNWYELNLKLVLGTMASGIGSSNMAQLLSFLDLPNCKTLNRKFFKNTELTIGLILKKVALEEEVRLIINNEE